MSVDLFTYGVLMHPELLQTLTGRTFIMAPVTLHEFRRYALEREGWPKAPVIVEEPGSSVHGVLVRNVDEDSVELLDDFEEVELGLYVKQQVKVVDDRGRILEAIAYVAGPESLGYLSEVWSPERFLERHYQDYLYRIIPDFLNEQ